jgi:NAD(P)-dependent dehydrogenase (short-subunit alcohol dehydrogenase family)
MNEDAPVALIVGGSGDIGRAVATKAGELGFRLAVTGRTAGRLDDAVCLLRDAGFETRGFLLDLSTENGVADFFGTFREAYRRLDLLVNAAGVSVPRQVIKATQAEFEETLRVNLVGPMLIARHGLALMRAAGAGTIINITSDAGKRGRKGFGAYSASKGGLIALTDSLREEATRYGVRVASICPERVDTRMHGSVPEREKMIRPTDIGSAVEFLLRLSPAAVVREIRICNTDVSAAMDKPALS